MMGIATMTKAIGHDQRFLPERPVGEEDGPRVVSGLVIVHSGSSLDT
jgi:hypothetical protein